MVKKLGDSNSIVTHITGGIDNDPNITEGQKKFIFSSTGNIMVATTEETSDNLICPGHDFIHRSGSL